MDALLNRAREAISRIDPRLLDATLVLALGLPPAVLVIVDGRFIALVAVVTSTVPLYFRRRYPLVSYAVQGIGLAISAPFASPIAGAVTLVAAIIVGAYSAGAHSSHRTWSLVLVGGPAVAVSLVSALSATPQPPWTLLILVPWLMGVSVRSQVGLLRDRTLALEGEQQAVARAAAAEERRRIARELHDVIAHSVSVMVVQAGAARRVMEGNPDQAAQALSAVESSGREALGELRRMLGLLNETEAEPLGPQPGLATLAALADTMSSAGLPVQLRTEGEPRPLPAGVELAAYRIVQEALTNTIKHASGAHARVVLGYDRDVLRVEVFDAGGPPPVESSGSGRGLVGMRERVAIYGGTLDAGRQPGGGFAVRARLPLSTG